MVGIFKPVTAEAMAAYMDCYVEFEQRMSKKLGPERRNWIRMDAMDDVIGFLKERLPNVLDPEKLKHFGLRLLNQRVVATVDDHLARACVESVSYTHLTLPTKRIVEISVVGVCLKKKRMKKYKRT
eukprot:TRINITY_DN43997_c0_g1_i1.p1 TRINITY_DN43997_c0_g1~~TRINITY_DN43997_c0_g1_i1.p1  ORF type:complete len:126 (+),score=32.15 TRINITY_DN43997_c0_g1_i1:111-488(+)